MDVHEGISAGDDRSRPSWAKISLGGFLLTGLMAGVGTQWFMSGAIPGPAWPYALVNLGIFALSSVASTLMVGKLAGVRTLGEWLRALLAVAIPLITVVALVTLTLPNRGE